MVQLKAKMESYSQECEVKQSLPLAAEALRVHHALPPRNTGLTRASHRTVVKGGCCAQQVTLPLIMPVSYKTTRLSTGYSTFRPAPCL